MRKLLRVVIVAVDTKCNVLVEITVQIKRAVIPGGDNDEETLQRSIKSEVPQTNMAVCGWFQQRQRSETPTILAFGVSDQNDPLIIGQTYVSVGSKKS